MHFLTKSMVCVLIISNLTSVSARITTEKDYIKYKELDAISRVGHIYHLIDKINKTFEINVSIDKLSNSTTLFNAAPVYGQVAYLEDSLETFNSKELLCSNISIELFTNSSISHDVTITDSSLIKTDNYNMFPIFPAFSALQSNKMNIKDPMGRENAVTSIGITGIEKALASSLDLVTSTLLIGSIGINAYGELVGSKSVGVQNNVLGFSQASDYQISHAIKKVIKDKNCGQKVE